MSIVYYARLNECECINRLDSVDTDEIKKKNLKKMLLFSICLASNLGGRWKTISMRSDLHLNAL